MARRDSFAWEALTRQRGETVGSSGHVRSCERIVNLTPHRVCIEVGSQTIVLDAAKDPLRVIAELMPLTPIEIEGVEIPVHAQSSLALGDLPPKRDGVLYFVSQMVLANSSRTDFVAPGELVRDGEGNVIACRSLLGHGE